MGEGHPSDKAESYDPDTGRWKELDDVPTPRLDAALAELDGTLYLVGGEAGGRASRLTQAYVPGDGWTGAAELETARTGLGLAALPGRLLAVGGSNQGGATASVEACRLFYDLYGYRKE
jgi:kelch-like protein 19